MTKPGGSSGAKDSSKEAFVVQVAYKFGYMGGQGLVATDSACSKSVAGQAWLQKYMLAGREAGLEMQFIDTQDDFRFGPSSFSGLPSLPRLRSSLVDAASWSGLPSSRERSPFSCQETS